MPRETVASDKARQRLTHLNLKRLLSRTAQQDVLARPSSRPCFPAEILIEIAERLILPRDILNFCLTSRKSHELLRPTLYAWLDLKTIERCRERLSFLLAHPRLARRVRKLVLRPSYLKASTPQSLTDEVWVAQAVELLAPNLRSLHTFIWDGLEMPQDQIWATLKNSCPQLKYIGSTTGSKKLDPDSHFYSFRELVGFSLTAKWLDDGPFSRDGEQFPSRLWSMLLVNSPQLEELTLGGLGTAYSTRLFDGRPLTQGRWPKLRSLNLGRILMQDRNRTQIQDRLSFSSFLAFHSTLKHFSLPYPNLYPPRPDTTWSSLKLDSFAGTLPYLFNFRPLCNLKELDLCSEPHPAWYLNYVRDALKAELLSLTSFAIWVDLSSSRSSPDPDPDLPSRRGDQETDHIKAFHSLLTLCPKVVNFKIMCSTKSGYTFPMKELSKALRDSPQLKTVDVYKVHTFVEEPMVQSAARIAREVPNIQHISLRYALHAWSDMKRMLIRQTGIYDVVTGGNGLPGSLLADERGAGVLRLFSRRYTHNMMPLREQLTGSLDSFLGRTASVET